MPRPGQFQVGSYTMEPEQIELIRVLAEKYDTNASDVVREIIRIGAPLYDEDMAALRERRAARVTTG